MTRVISPTTTHSICGRQKMIAAAAASILSIVVSAVGSGVAQAAPRTNSAAIAHEAELAAVAFERWEGTRSPVDHVRFLRARERTAELIELDMGITDGALVTAWADVPADKQLAVLAAISQLGVPYRSIASEPGFGFDCSGLTSWAYERAGVDIARVSSDQMNDARPVDAAAAESGDLVYYPGHISMYIGADLMVHSPDAGSTVEITDLPDKSLRFGEAVDVGSID